MKDSSIFEPFTHRGWINFLQNLFSGFQMAEGVIKRLTDKGFGFIDSGEEKDLFFHASDLTDGRYEDLQEGMRVSFEKGRGPKGAKAEHVKPI